MIGRWWLNHVHDVLAAASDEQLLAIELTAQAELDKRKLMKKGAIKCRRTRAVERVAKQLIQGMLLSVPKEEAAPTENVA